MLAAVAIAILAALLGSHGSHDPAASTTSVGVRQARRPPPPTDAQADDKQAVKAVLAYTPFVKQGSAHARDVALTFDDGPGPYTPGVLSVLERFHVHATFFVIGKMLRYFGAATVRAIEDGDVIGDHTQNHPMLAKLSTHDQYEELFEQIARVELLGGQRPDLFRPPYGSFDATTMRQLHHLHLLMVLWSVDTDDYLQPGVATIVQRALAGAQPGRDPPDARRRRSAHADDRGAAGHHPRAARPRPATRDGPAAARGRPAAAGPAAAAEPQRRLSSPRR